MTTFHLRESNILYDSDVAVLGEFSKYVRSRRRWRNLQLCNAPLDGEYQCSRRVQGSRCVSKGYRRCAVLLVAAATMLGAATEPTIGRAPQALMLDPFYAKSLDAAGIPVSASAAVPDAAIYAAAVLVRDMLTKRPDLARALVARGQRIAIMAPDEGTTDLPEQRDWKKPTRDDPRLTVCERKLYDTGIGRQSDQDYWNSRARGMGGVLTSGATENLLGFPGTRYYGENILVHEFSHAILDAIETVDRPLYRSVERAYAQAKRRGLWKGEYGETTVQEYWAEGTQFWFESNKIAVIDGVRVLSAADLSRHDRALAAVLRRAYGDRHRLAGDVYWRHPARVPPGGPPRSTAEAC